MGDGNDIEIPTFSINIEIQKDLWIDIEISIYDPFTRVCEFVYSPLSSIFVNLHVSAHAKKICHNSMGFSMAIVY